MKRLLAVTLMLIMVLSLASCAVKEGPATTPTNAPGTNETGKVSSTLFDEPVTITVLAPYHDTWPFQEDWYVLDLIKRKTNVTYVMDAVASTGYYDRYNTLLTTHSLPDIVWDWTSAYANTHGPDGAFANLLEHMDKLPNFKKYYEQNQSAVISKMGADGGLYSFPVVGLGNTNLRGWLYRKDIFEKHNIQIPKDENEFYNVLKQLKELYPESYPLVFRENLNHFKMAATAWGTCNTEYYDWNAKVWKFGPIEDNFRDMLAYYKKLYQEELIPPDWNTLTAQQWSQIFTTHNAFLTLDYIARVDTWGDEMRQADPTVDIRYMPPPAFGKNGQSKLRFSCEENTVMSVSINSNLANTLKFMDWMYSDEGIDVLSWGEEGVTYEIANNQRKWIPGDDGKVNVTTIRQRYGLSTNGMFTRFNYDAHISLASEQLKEADRLAQQYQDIQIPTVSLNQDEASIDATTGAAIRNHYRGEASKFILGERPLEEWDMYVQEMKSLGLDEYLDMLNVAFKRQTGGS